MQMGYGVPVSTMSVGDLYLGTPSYASPPPTQEQVNEGAGDVEAKATKSATKQTTGTVASTGFELPTLLVVAAVVYLLIRYY